MRRDIVLFLGLVAIICGGIIAAVIFLFDDGGGESSVCDRPLAPLGESEISQLGFQTEDADLARVIEAAEAGDLQAAQEAFFGDVHDFTHDVDQPLREVDEELAKELCEAVMTLEEELFATDPSTDAIAKHATRIRDLLRDAAEALGYARPGE
ncbi:MAG: hypothetical protein E3J29_06300 [Dehalococcoidia bacterium]|nr:MAG: hypothetical protein E3J29_06300 [Dehalococcoidia bacterium]